MKKLIKNCVILSSLVLAGCATTHPGELAQSKANDKRILISVDRNAELSDKHYIFYEFTIENKSNTWKQVQVIDVDFDGQNSEILSDDKLVAWIEGAENKLRAAQYNQQLLLGSIAAVGGVVALTSRDTQVQTAGAGVLVGSAAVSAGVGLSQSKTKATSGARGVNGTVNVPQSHVFVASQVAPESYIRRWVVIAAPPSQVKPNKSAGPVFAKAQLNFKVLIDQEKPEEFSAKVQVGFRRP